MVPEISMPVDEDAVRDIVESCLASETALEIIGAGTKRSLGRPMAAKQILTTRALSGISLYEPAELVLRAHAGTLLSHLQAILEKEGQQLAFEPPDLGPLLGGDADSGTIGGVVASNLAGPRRFRAGAARDHLLGARVVTGRAEVIKTGGRVVKNVTGYDLCKLLTGSYGTLGVLTEVTLKVLPAPEKTRTLLVFGLDAQAAQTAMATALNSPHDISGAAYLPEAVAMRSGVGYVADAGGSVTAFRLEGPEPSVIARGAAVRALMAGQGSVEELHYHNSKNFWDEVGRAAAFAHETDTPVWRVSLPPADMARVMAAIGARGLTEYYADWGGGLIWIRVGAKLEDAGTAVIRDAIAPCGGHATLIRASNAMRSRVPVFQPAPPGLAALSARIKHGFDPHHILNRGRMVDGV
jgi:glycolate oxidase FAD binding subunit